MTLEGKGASSFSHKDLTTSEGHYFLLNYSDHIQQWLELIKENDCIEERLKIFIEDYLSVIKELSKCNSLLNEDFITGNGIEKYKFNALLELRFWQELEEAIYIKYKEKYQIDNQHRYYTYSKILKSHKKNGIKPKNQYGIIFAKREKDDSLNIRLSVNPKSKELSIKFGKFENNKWENDKFKPQIDIEGKINMSRLENRTKLEFPINMILNTLSEIV